MSARPDVDLGGMSEGEGAMAQSTAAVREHYDCMLGIARKARQELLTALHEGVPRLAPLPSGGMDGAVKMAATYRLIHSYAWANRALFNAAADLCAIENIPDDGVAEGLLWEVQL